MSDIEKYSRGRRGAVEPGRGSDRGMSPRGSLGLPPPGEISTTAAITPLAAGDQRAIPGDKRREREVLFGATGGVVTPLREPRVVTQPSARQDSAGGTPRRAEIEARAADKPVASGKGVDKPEQRKSPEVVQRQEPAVKGRRGDEQRARRGEEGEVRNAAAASGSDEPREGRSSDRQSGQREERDVAPRGADGIKLPPPTDQPGSGGEERGVESRDSEQRGDEQRLEPPAGIDGPRKPPDDTSSRTAGFDEEPSNEGEGIELSAEAILMSAVARHQERLAKTGERKGEVVIGEQTEVSLGMFGGSLIVAVDDPEPSSDLAALGFRGPSRARVRIGHYDPGMQGFFYYPELVRDEEAAIIDPLAVEMKAKSAQNETLDDTADVIRDLHRRHREVLLQDNLIYRIAERYGTLPSDERRVPEYLLDKSVSFHVCLMPKVGGEYDIEGTVHTGHSLSKVEDATIAIRMRGSLFRDESGELQREPLGYIKVGRLDLDDPNKRYVPDQRLVTDEEFGSILELAHELQLLKATTLPNLDTLGLDLRRQYRK